MTTEWTAEDVARATQGTTAGAWVAHSVGIDTRTLAKGALFAALPGAHVDGHDYVKAALEAGAVAAIVSKPVENVDPAQLVMVADVETALQDLGIAARARSRAKFIGVTGSVGKTGTKEMLAKALSPIGSVYATKGNLNNHLGVPINLANLPRNVDYAIL